MKRSEILLMILQVPVDLLMLLTAIISAYYLRFSAWAVETKAVEFELTLAEFFFRSLWVFLLLLIIFTFIGLYSTDQNRKLSRDLTRVFLGCTIALAGVALYIVFSQQMFDSRFLILAAWIFSVLYVSLGRVLIRGLKGLLYRTGSGMRRIAIVGSGEVANSIVQALKERKELGYEIVGLFKDFSVETRNKIQKLSVDELLFTNPRAREKEALQAIRYCSLRHIVFKYSADLFSTYTANMDVHPLAGIPIVELKRTPLEGWGRVLKRISDIFLSGIILILVSPVILLSSIIILLETGRPIIYRNERVGIRGRHFFTLKFRSMYQKDSTGVQFGEQGKKAEKMEEELIQKQGIKKGPIYKIGNDPRVTRFGRFIRRWSIDELPNFFNVMKGEMSIVGPRPHQPREVEKYEKDFPQVFTLKPGITGLSQISGRSDLSFEDEMKLDIFYIEKWSPFLDAIIFIKTPFVIFKKRKVL
ncbi:MAG: sugar transferase [Candidatus Magasanikbacteria bacterium]